MKRMFLVFATAAMILPWFSAAEAQADLIQWSISGGPSGPNYSSNEKATTLLSNNFDWNGRLEISPGFELPTQGAFTQSVVLADLRLVSVAPPQDPLHFIGGSMGNYAVSLTLTDQASGDSGSLTFRGNLSGTATNGSDQVNLTNTFLGPTSQTLFLGQHQYTVTIGPFVPPGPLTYPQGWSEHISQQDGSISVKVAVATPEPFSLTLACLGLPLGLAGWFRRRRA